MQDERRWPDREIPWPNAVTVVLAGETEEQRRWATSAALDLVRRLARSCPKVVMADLQPRGGGFGEELGAGEEPGVVNVLFRGSTFSKVARRPESESFYYLPIGGSPPPLDELYGSPRWGRIAQRFREVDAYLLLCVWAEDWQEAGPIRGFEPAIVLNGIGDELVSPPDAHVVSEFLAPPEIREGAVWSSDGLPDPAWRGEPEGASGPSVEPPPLEPESVDAAESAAGGGLGMAKSSGFDASVAERGTRAVAGRWVEDEGADVEEGGHEHRAAVHAGRAIWRVGLSRRLPARPGPMIVAAAAIVVVALGLLWAFGGGSDADRVEAAAGTVAAGTSAAKTDPATPAPSPATPATVQQHPLPYSVLIASYSSFQDAMDRRRRWTRQDLPFYVAPTVVRGVVYYRVLAGLLPTREQAVELMHALVRDGVKDTIRNWDVRPARLAFSFGTFPDREAAERMVETLAGRDVPAYVVVVAGEGGGRVYRVYAGGYEETRDARPLEQQIGRAGLDADLVERVGAVEP